jgi:hypothetical protein
VYIEVAFGMRVMSVYRVELASVKGAMAPYQVPVRTTFKCSIVALQLIATVSQVQNPK